ncbi:MAG: exosortase system-associated protein, TIGR04073 family [Candidatus Omnitrophota bacterium]
MKKLLPVLFIVILVFAFSATTFAADMPAQTVVQKSAPQSVPQSIPQSIQPSTYPAGPIQKAERGFNNALFGWTELPKRIVDETKASNPIKGLLLGTFQGTCKAFARTVSGLSEIATFPIGRYDKPAVLPDMPAAK